MQMLNVVYQSIDQKIFNCNLNDVKVRWCDELTSRAAVSYQLSSIAAKQTYMRFSKTWFKDRPLENFVQAVLVSVLRHIACHCYKQNQTCMNQYDSITHML